VSLAGPIAKFIVSVKDGQVVPQGSIEDAMENDSDIAAKVKEDEAKVDRAGDEVNPETALNNGADSNAGKLIVAEDTEEGHVSWSSCRWKWSLRCLVMSELRFQ